MMKKTVLMAVFALSAFGASVFAEGTTQEATKAKEQADAKATAAAVSDPNYKTLLALGMDVKKHSTLHVPQGGSPKNQAQAVGIVKN